MLKNYNPDVLSCLANLSNDEVFTPPNLANQMLDMLPQELFSNKNTTFLDPCCKSGVFLREIAKRLIVGLEKDFPDLQKRLNHIFTKQLFGIAITELTSLLARRSVYCSKHADGKYSICSDFDDENGNIRFERTEHTWENGRCKYCGANQEEYDREDGLETHAYQFIHNPKDLLKMKFDVIIGNPPYHLSTGGTKSQAIPLYHLFVEQAKKLNPRYITMIIPSRWFAGGMGLDNFREEMLKDKRIREIVDYVNAKDCFPGISLGGGVNYFLWDRDNKGKCKITNIHDNKKTTSIRALDDMKVFVRYNEAVSIIDKVKKVSHSSISEIVSSLCPFGIQSKVRGKLQPFKDSLTLYASDGVSYVPISSVTSGYEYIKNYKVMISKVTSEHAGEPNKDGKYKVLSTIKVLEPDEICTFSYFLIGKDTSRKVIENISGYLKTRFVRFLLLLSVSSINLSKDKFQFVPMQDFNETWTDEKLYKKYGLTQEEIDFIESMIRPME